MRIIKKELILLSALLFCLAGCSSSDPDEGGNAGSFNVSIGGSTSTTFGGDAYVTFNPFAILLGHGSTEAVPMYFGSGPTQPAPGTYNVVHGGGASDFRISVYVTPSESYYATSGTVKVLTSTDSEVTGDVSFTATRNNVTTPETINVTGTFRAVIPQYPARNRDPLVMPTRLALYRGVTNR